MGVLTGCRRGRIWNDSSSSTGVDKDLLGDRRGDHNRLGLMLKATTVRYVGRFLEDPLDVPWPVVEYLAGQLGIADTSCVKRATPTGR